MVVRWWCEQREICRLADAGVTRPTGAFCTSGEESGHGTTRARILLNTDEGWSASRVARALDVAEGTVFRIKRRFAEEGSAEAVQDQPQANQYRKLDERSVLAEPAGPVPEQKPAGVGHHLTRLPRVAPFDEH